MGLLFLILTLKIKNIYRKNQSLNQLKTKVSNIFLGPFANPLKKLFDANRHQFRSMKIFYLLITCKSSYIFASLFVDFVRKMVLITFK